MPGWSSHGGPAAQPSAGPAIVDADRVVALSPVRRGADGMWSFGTGYLVAPRLVMTAAHVLLDGAAGGAPRDSVRPEPEDARQDGAVRVRLRHRAQRVGAVLIWSGLDVALLHIDDPAWVAPVTGHTRWGRATTTEPNLPCAAIGYPLSQVPTGERSGEDRAAEHILGHINPITGQPIGSPIAGRYAISVDDTTPITAIEGQSPWAGASGSAVICGAGLVVGVIVADELAYQRGRLTAVRAERLFAAPGFREAIEAVSGSAPWLESVELAPMLVQPSRVRPGAPPADLLRAEHEVVRFRGRQEELDLLRDWCDDRPGLSVRLLHGGGGQGKTRLSRELVRCRRDEGWLAGELQRRADPGRLWLLGAVAGPTLLVIDYAETATPESIDAVIRALAGYVGDHPVRLLLLARTAGEWWDELQSRLLIEGDAIGLAGLEASPSGREGAYRRAVADFAAAKAIAGAPGPGGGGAAPSPSGSPPGVAVDWPALAAALPVPDLSGRRYDSVLSLHMRALADLLQAGPDPVRGAPARPADILLAHEQRYWTAYWSERVGFREPWHPGLLRRAVAAATLYGADTRAEAIALLRLIPGWAVEKANVWEFAADWLHEMYPPSADGYLGGLQPDPLGEHLVALAVRDAPALVRDLLPAGTSGQREHGLTVLSRVAADHGDLRELIVATFAAAARELSVPAIVVAVRAEQPGPLVDGLRAALDALLADAASAHPEVDTVLALAEIADALPPVTAVLAEYAVAAFAAFVERVEPGPGEASDLTHCAALATLSFRLSNVGRYVEALETGQRAQRLLDQVEADPEAHRAARLAALTAIGVALQNLKRFDEAAQSQRLALELLRQAESGPEGVEGGDGVDDPRGPDSVHRVSVLSNLSMVLEMAGHSAEAVAAAAEADELMTRMSRSGAIDPILTNAALVNLAMIEGPVRRVELLTEAVAVLRSGMLVNPDLYVLNLGLTLTMLGAALSDAEQNSLARVYLDESIEILRSSDRSNPGLVGRLLATSLGLRGMVLSELGLAVEALASAEEAVVYHRRALAAWEGSDQAAEAESELASALTAHVDILELLGRFAAMEVAAQTTLDLYRRLAERDPAAHRPMVARLLIDRASAVLALRGPAEAVGSMAEAVEIYREMFAAVPDRARFRLARALRSTAVMYAQLGELDQGAELLDEAERLLRAAPAELPADRERLADVLLAQANNHRLGMRLEPAEPPAREAAELYRSIIADGGAATARRLNGELCGVLEIVALCAAQRGDHDEAVAAAREAVALRRLHAATDHDGVMGLAASLNALGGTLIDAGQADAALPDLAEAVRLLRSLADGAPASVMQLFGLASGLAVHALGLAGAGHPTQALDAASEAVDRLAELDAELTPLTHIRAGVLRGLGAVHGELMAAAGELTDDQVQRLAGSLLTLTGLGLRHELFDTLVAIAEPGADLLRALPPAPDQAVLAEREQVLARFLLLAFLARSAQDDVQAATTLLAEANERVVATMAGAAGDDEALSDLRQWLTEANQQWLEETGLPQPPWMRTG